MLKPKASICRLKLADSTLRPALASVIDPSFGQHQYQPWSVPEAPSPYTMQFPVTIENQVQPSFGDELADRSSGLALVADRDLHSGGMEQWFCCITTIFVWAWVYSETPHILAAIRLDPA